MSPQATATPVRLGHKERALSGGVDPGPDVQVLLGAPEAAGLADAVLAWAQARKAEVAARSEQDRVGSEVGLDVRQVQDSRRWPDLPPKARDAVVEATLAVRAASKIEAAAKARMTQAMSDLIRKPSTRAWLAEQYLAVAEQYAAARGLWIDTEQALDRLRSATLEGGADVAGRARTNLLGIAATESLRLPRDNENHARKVGAALAEGARDE